MALILTVLQGPDKGRRFELPDNEPQQIGRSSESLPLRDPTISRRHAELTPDDGRWLLRDLKSSNGTYVNGARVTDRRILKPGDQIRTGSTLMTYGEAIGPPTQRVDAAKKGDIDVSVEHTVASNDDSMIMASPEPSQSAEFQLRVLYELLELIGSAQTRQDLLDRIMDVVFDYFQADRGFILLLRDSEDETSELDAAVVRLRHGEVDPQRPPKISRTIVHYVMRKNVGVLSSNAMSDKRFATGDSVRAVNIHSAMCVPIRFKDRLYGVIQLDCQVANFTFTEDQLTLLTAIGVQGGLALSNMRLVEARLSAERLAAVGQTVASLSHSIKNILQGMRGGADVVELGLRKNDQNVVKNGWTIVARNLERIYELTVNMLAFSKERKPDLEMTNLTGILEEVVELVQKQFDQKQAALLTDLSPDVPPVPVDVSGIHQAVLNLVNNALDAVEPESGVVSLSEAYDEQRQEAIISVADNGAGMSQDTRNRLFEPFHSTKGLRGTGLGLVVTKKIIDEHGGRITCESIPDEGTTFTLYLPMQSDRRSSSADTHGPSSGDTA
ncbi:MAG: ATP-binding protein [Phycisphaeraceae bacterium]